MKKIFLTSAMAISMIVPAMAETTAPDIAAGAESASCDSGTLNTTSGESTLSAQWTANVIDLTWYNGDVAYSTNTCTYDGGITLPASTPQRVGYNFAGWQVKQALFDLRTLADKIDIEGESFYARSTYENADYCFAYGNGTVESDGPEICTTESAALSDISMHQWKTKFSYGTVKGIARCSTTPGEWLETGNPADSGGGQYCWCQATGYATSGSNSFANVSSPSWVFNDADGGDADSCARLCADICAAYVRDDSYFRSAVFGVSNN